MTSPWYRRSVPQAATTRNIYPYLVSLVRPTGSAMCVRTCYRGTDKEGLNVLARHALHPELEERHDGVRPSRSK